MSQIERETVDYEEAPGKPRPATPVTKDHSPRLVAEIPHRHSDRPEARTESKEPEKRRESGAPDAGHDQSDSKTDPPALKPKKKTIVIAALAAVAVLAAGSWYYLGTKDIESTDDAQVAGNAVTVAPKISGQVSELAVNDNQRVKAGDLIARIDPRDYIASRDQARANLAIAKAQLANAQANLQMTVVTAPAKLDLAKAQADGAIASRDIAQSNLRRQNSLTDLATTVQNKEQASSTARSAVASVIANEAQVKIADLVKDLVSQSQAQVDQAKAQVDQAAAQLVTAELNLTYTEIRAPQDGWITHRNVQVGSYAVPGQALVSLVSPDMWVTANFKENQLNRMRRGQEVTIKLDAYKGVRLKGHIDSLQMGTGAVFTAFPAENATGNFVKIVQRVPVKIVIDSDTDPERPLPLGLSVEPEVHLK